MFIAATGVSGQIFLTEKKHIFIKTEQLISCGKLDIDHLKEKGSISVSVYVMVQFYPWFKFNFPLFFNKIMYDNEFKTKENER